MKKAIFVVDWGEDKPNVPPNQPDMDESETLSLGTEDGCGYTVLSHVPSENTCIVEICALDENMDLMKLDDRYLWVEDIEMPLEEGDVIDV